MNEIASTRGRSDNVIDFAQEFRIVALAFEDLRWSKNGGQDIVEIVAHTG